MKSALRIAGCWVLKIFCVNAFFRWRNRNKVLILWYHGISRDEVKELSAYDERHITRDRFHNHLQFLRANGYQFISLDRYAEACRMGENLSRAVVLTFDDGFRNVLTNAVPEMREIGATGTIYVVVESAKSGTLLWTDQVEIWVRAQTGAQITLTIGGEALTFPAVSVHEKQIAMKGIKKRLRELDDSLRRREIQRFYEVRSMPEDFQIATLEEFRRCDSATLHVGGHSMHHPNLTQLRSKEEFDAELSESKRVLEAAMGRPCPHFAYPAGSFNSTVIEEVRRAGYQTAVTTQSGLNDFSTADLLQLKRVGTNSSQIMFEAMSSGSYFAVSRFFRT